MRVVHLSTYHHFGGAAVAATRLHRALLANGVDSTMLIGTSKRQDAPRPEPGVQRLAHNLLSEYMAFGRFALERAFFLPYERDRSVRFQFSPAWTGADLTFHPAVQQADVIHLHWINFGFLSLDSLKSLFALGKPVVWTLHDQWAFTGGCHYTRGCEQFVTHCGQCPYLRKPGPHDLAWRVFARKQAVLAGVNLHLTPPSQWLAHEAQRSALLGHVPLTVIPYAIDQTVFRPINRAEAAAQFDLRLSEGETLVRPRLLFGSATVTDPRKGFAYFAEALTLLHQQYPALAPEIIVFGKGRSYLFDALPYPIRHLGLLTSEAAIVAAYNLADALIVPSLEDNLPNTVIEALACGTPVLGFATGGIPEMIDHQENGFLAAVGSAQELANGLHWLLTDPDPAQRRQAARQSAEARFSEPVVAGKFQELYNLMSERVKE